ncbi:cobalt ECF transporter T component CbiQ [Bacillus alveayuensis]|jgi:cobalt/nickel transport system permease protein|uniref:cobalt ECF transporter T component CbiQ n=1 Tax=Aeribacillus alveayuensis TaxID=279215 RepID=UPI0005D121F6|nr:cobalt ECF transporter T component CbiQ [Bacillus alveayuensis]
MMTIDYYSYRNALRSVHPVEKFIISFFSLLFTLWMKDAFVSAILFMTMSLLIIFHAKIPINVYGKLLRLPFSFILLSLISIVFSISTSFVQGDSVLFYQHYGPFHIYILKQQVDAALTLFFISITSISILYFFLLTTPFHEVLYVLKWLKAPQLLIDLIAFSYRFLFLFFRTAKQIYVAQQIRQGYQSFYKSLTSLSSLVSSLFIQALNRANELQRALEIRGDGSFEYVQIHESSLSKRSILNVYWYICFLIILYFLRTMWK